MRLPFVIAFGLAFARPAAAAEPVPDLGAVVRLVRHEGRLVLRAREDADWTELRRLAEEHPSRFRRSASSFAGMGGSARFVLKRTPDTEEITLLGSIAVRGSPFLVQVSTTKKLQYVPLDDPKEPSLDESDDGRYRLMRGDEQVIGSIEELMWASPEAIESGLFAALTRLGLDLAPARDDPLVARLVLNRPRAAPDEARAIDVWAEALGAGDFSRRQEAEKALRAARLSSGGVERLARIESAATNLEMKRRLERILSSRGRLAAAWRFVVAEALMDDADYLEELATTSPVKAIREAARARRVDR